MKNDLPPVTPFPTPPYNEDERKKKAKAEEDSRNRTPTTAAAFNDRLKKELADKKNKNKKS